jgi:phosphoribosyl-ATP pyrophosphohydrolase/phosphoribosyl-AMP cyclohydrolase
MDATLPEIRFDERGLVPVIAQDAESGEVLMLAYANREALDKTFKTGEAHYYSRSRGELWRKGATSGHTQEVLELRVDCDEDAVLYRVRQRGPACHTGARSCFYRSSHEDAAASLGESLAMLERVVAARLNDLPAGSYVASLHRAGLGRIAQKVVEEAGESIIAALERKPDELTAEAADLLFHLVVLLQESGVSLRQVASELTQRHRPRDAE